MDWASLAVSTAGLAVGLAGLSIAFVQVRHGLRRRRRRHQVPQPVRHETYDAFISYAEPDAGPAEELAARLGQEGIQAFLKKWIEPGLVEHLEQERALAASATGILVFSQATMREPAIRDEYAAILRRVHTGGRRFIPVLVEDVELPPFAAIRKPLDLRSADPADYDTQLAALVRALRSTPIEPGGPTSR